MSLGKDWQDSLRQQRVRTTVHELGKHQLELEREAQEIIRKIPPLIKEAKHFQKNTIKIYGWITFDDVAGTDANRVDLLYQRTRGILRREDLANKALIIFDWCEQNGLECFMVSEKFTMNDHEYNLHARPKA